VNASFSRGPRGTVTVQLSDTDVALLRTLLGQLLELLDVDDPLGDEADELERALGIGGNTSVSDDPALARLFPDAYRDDEGAAAEFRRYTEADLRAGKRAGARTALDTLDRVGSGGRRGRVELTQDEAAAWLGTLNDLRLTLGTRLGVTDDNEELHSRFPEDDPRAVLVPLYLWLGWLQETLIESLP
jgi:hypothetical protein